MYIMCYHLYLFWDVLMSDVRPQQHSKEVILVSSVEEIQSAIVSLAPEKYARLRAWFLERDLGDNGINKLRPDAQADKLDFLIAEAMVEKTQGHLREPVNASSHTSILGVLRQFVRRHTKFGA